MNGYLSFFILQGVERFLWRGGPAVPCYQVHSETNSPKAVPKLSLTILLKTRSCFLWKASCSRVCAYSKVTLHSWEGCSWVSEPSAFGAAPAPTICSPWTSSFYVLYTVPTNARVESYFRHFMNSFKKIINVCLWEPELEPELEPGRSDGSSFDTLVCQKCRA